MAGLVPSSEEGGRFPVMMRRRFDSEGHRRLNVLLLLDDSWSPARIAAASFVDASTVTEHQAALEAFVTDRFHRVGRPDAGI